MVADGARNADPARLSDRLQPGSDIYTVAEYVLGFDDYIAKVDPNSKANALVFRRIGIAVDHRALDFGRAANRIHYTRKFHQQAVARVLDDPAAVFLDLRVK